MAAQAPVCDFGWNATGFTLRATDGRTYSLADLQGEHGTLIMFICNHCPYVKAVIDRIVRDAREIKKFGVNSAAICSNDAASYPEDSFEKMRAFTARSRRARGPGPRRGRPSARERRPPPARRARRSA